MKAAERQEFTVKCECIIMRNNLQINGKKKSKFTLIALQPERQALTATPFASQKQEDMLTFPLAKLKAIHKKYIDEGKITLEFIERTERLQLKGTDITNPDQMQEYTSQILISSASKENLELLIKKIQAIKSTQEKKVPPPPPATKTKKQPADLPVEEQRPRMPLSRKELMNNAMNPPKPQIVPIAKRERRIGLFDLPSGLIDLIFSYTRLTLEMRIINRRFSQHVLHGITSIRLSDQVDQVSFNKLAKWAVSVECRMKNVRNIELADKYEQQELVQGRAKTLRFGGWKEMTAKNVLQLKGLRIYCLEMPYFIKFDLSQLFGLRLVQLRLKAPQMTSTRCDFVKTQDLAYLIKTIKDLRVLQVPFANSDLLAAIQHPRKMAELRMYYLSDNLKEQTWKDLSRFDNLKVLSIWMMDRFGSKKEDHQVALKWPQTLIELEIGHFIAKESLDKLPLSIEALKLVGENFLNIHVESMYLPNLKTLDISTSRNVRQDILEFMQNVSIITYWQRNTIDFVANYARSKGLRVTTLNPNFK